LKKNLQRYLVNYVQK